MHIWLCSATLLYILNIIHIVLQQQLFFKWRWSARYLWQFWRDSSPTFARQEFLFESTSTCKTVGFSLNRLCSLPDSRRQAFLLELVQGSKDNEKEKREKRRKGEEKQGKSIHPVASASTSVLNPQAREEHSPSCICFYFSLKSTSMGRAFTQLYLLLLHS